MDSTKYFCVIEFIHRPHPDVAKYVIVPDCWIKLRGNRISVSYPEIRPGQIVEEFYHMDPRESPNNIKWNEYLSELKHTAENYNEAMVTITKKNEEARRRQIMAFLKSNQREGNHQDIIPTTKKHEGVKSKQGDSTSTPKVYHKPDLIEKTMINDLISLTDNFSKQLKAATSSCGVPTEPSHDMSGDESGEGEEDPTQQTNKEAFDSLPEEYFQDLTRTLKHPRRLIDLKRLVPGYNIFVKPEIIKNILENATNKSELYNLLLQEVFTKEALEKCNLFRKSRAGSAKKRPALYKHGVQAIGEFVRKIAKQKEWPHDKNSFKKDISKTFYNIRTMLL